MQLKALSDVMLTNAVARFEGGSVALKAETLKDLVKNALIYENLYRNKELFDEFYKKLLWWLEFYRENRENRDEVKRQLSAIALWLEKKVLCGGEPEIVEREVINYEEEKNLLNLLKVEDFKLTQGEVKKKKVNYLASKMRGFGWVYTLTGVPYHHGRVHSAPTPTYTSIQGYSGATFSIHTRL